MRPKFRFAVISDPHIALPQTIWDHPQRFHLVEVSIPAIEAIFDQLAQLDLDFLLLPGDLTQHGEPENHAWLSDRLARLPYPAYVVPGNHDVIERQASSSAIGLAEFPHYYQKFGYTDTSQPYYCREILPGVSLIGLNSIFFDANNQQIPMGRLDDAQLSWLRQVLTERSHHLMLVMVHHNVIEHLPNQAQHPLGRRYMLENASELLDCLQLSSAKLIFTGHLHVQDIAQWQSIYEITTGSLVSYPHPYRVLNLYETDRGQLHLDVESDRISAIPNFPELQHLSREWMGDRSAPFMLKLLTNPPLNLSPQEAEQFAPELRYFWADIAQGDAQFSFPTFPPALQQHFQRFGAIDPQGNYVGIDNRATLIL